MYSRNFLIKAFWLSLSNDNKKRHTITTIPKGIFNEYSTIIEWKKKSEEKTTPLFLVVVAIKSRAEYKLTQTKPSETKRLLHNL